MFGPPLLSCKPTCVVHHRDSAKHTSGALRPAVKIVVSAMLSLTGELNKLPVKVREVIPDLSKYWTGRRIAQAVIDYHAPIAHLFGKDMGIHFMWQDSAILMKVLRRLMGRGIPALPMHDGVMVQESAEGVAITIMKEASRELLGVELPVEMKCY